MLRYPAALTEQLLGSQTLQHAKTTVEISRQNNLINFFASDLLPLGNPDKHNECVLFVILRVSDSGGEDAHHNFNIFIFSDMIFFPSPAPSGDSWMVFWFGADSSFYCTIDRHSDRLGNLSVCIRC